MGDVVGCLLRDIVLGVVLCWWWECAEEVAGGRCGGGYGGWRGGLWMS